MVMSDFKTNKERLKARITELEQGNDVRKTYLEVISKNPEIEEYNQWRIRKQNSLYFLLGMLGMITVLGLFLIILGGMML